MRRFIVTTEGQNHLGHRELCEHWANEQWVEQANLGTPLARGIGGRVKDSGVRGADRQQQ
jgi:hypothetical protein